VFGTGIEWVTRNAPTNVLLVEERGLERIHTITVVTGNGPFDPEKIAVANALAAETASRIDLLYPVKGGATDAQRATIMEYLAELEDLCTVPVHRSIVDTDDPNRDIVSEIGAADLLIIGTDGGPITGSLFGRPADWIVDSVEATAIQVQARGTKRPNILRRAFERLVF
jgi:nucleotide-binding universal stress UspA family protein